MIDAAVEEIALEPDDAAGHLEDRLLALEDALDQPARGVDLLLDELAVGASSPPLRYIRR